MKKLGLYNSSFEHDACGIGAVVNIKGKKSHDVIDNCLEILENLKHRGGIGVEENTGDGAGILMQIPHEFFQKKALDNGLELPKSGDYAVGTVFLPMEKQRMLEAKHFIEEMMKENSFNILFWREVPVSINGIGETALKAMPKIMQVFLRKPEEVSAGMDFERSLYMLRRKIEKKLNHVEGFYIASFGYAIITSLVISFLGRLVKPILELLLLPMTIITTGLSYPLINVIILKLASLVMGSAFVVKGWILPFFISIFLSIITIVLDQIITKKIVGE